MKYLKTAGSGFPCQLLVYGAREESRTHLDDFIATADPQKQVMVVHWGPDIPMLLKRLRGSRIVYFAHSTGYSFSLPANVPIVAVSRHSLAYWGTGSPGHRLYYVPNIISSEFTPDGLPRDIDVLVQKRKSSAYLLNDLIPRLETRCRVRVLDEWVPDLSAVLNRARVYLYDSHDHWARKGRTEGFGLPPLEAMACGCRVFATIHGGLTDYLEPGVNCEQIRLSSVDYDVRRILQAVAGWSPPAEGYDPAGHYREKQVTPRLLRALGDIQDFFDESGPAGLYTPPGRGRGVLTKLRQRFGRS